MKTEAGRHKCNPSAPRQRIKKHYLEKWGYIPARDEASPSANIATAHRECGDMWGMRGGARVEQASAGKGRPN